MDSDAGIINLLGRILSGLQVGRSIAGGEILGVALEPYDEVRRRLGTRGWTSSAEYELKLLEYLAQHPTERHLP